MKTLYELASVAFTGIGLALFVCSVVLVPHQGLQASDLDEIAIGTPVPQLCGSHSACDTNCAAAYPSCGTGACTKNPTQCNACKCRLIGPPGTTFCECQHKSF
jgi:hypothetical protein